VHKKKLKKHSEVMQTLHTGCSKAEPEILSRHRPPSWGHGMAKFNQLQTQFGDD